MAPAISASRCRWGQIHRPNRGRTSPPPLFNANALPSAMLTENGSSRVHAKPANPLRRCCSQITPSYDIVNYGSMEHGYRRLCNQCFNTKVAKIDGLEGFEHVKFEPVGLADCTGEVHEFYFRTNLFGTGVALDAFELRDGRPAGYQFQIIGNPKDDLLVLLGRLIEKIRRSLSTKHLMDGKLGL
jgi:hypothetical protein